MSDSGTEWSQELQDLYDKYIKEQLAGGYYTPGVSTDGTVTPQMTTQSSQPYQEEQVQVMPPLSMDSSNMSKFAPIYLDTLTGKFTTAKSKDAVPLYMKLDAESQKMYLTTEETGSQILNTPDIYEMLTSWLSPTPVADMTGQIQNAFSGMVEEGPVLTDNSVNGVPASYAPQKPKQNELVFGRFSVIPSFDIYTPEQLEKMNAGPDKEPLLPGEYRLMLEIGDQKMATPITLSSRAIKNWDKVNQTFNSPVDLTYGMLHQAGKYNPVMGYMATFLSSVSGGIGAAFKYWWNGMKLQGTAATLGSLANNPEMWAEYQETTKNIIDTNYQQIASIKFQAAREAWKLMLHPPQEYSEELKKETEKWEEEQAGLSMSSTPQAAFGAFVPAGRAANTLMKRDREILMPQSDMNLEIAKQIIDSKTTDPVQLQRAIDLVRKSVEIDIKLGYTSDKKFKFFGLGGTNYSNPYWMFTEDVRPELHEQFVEALTQAQVLKLASGKERHFTYFEVYRIKELLADPVTEMVGYVLTDPTTFIDLDLLTGAAGAVRKLIPPKSVRSYNKVFGQFAKWAGKEGENIQPAVLKNLGVTDLPKTMTAAEREEYIAKYVYSTFSKDVLQNPNSWKNWMMRQSVRSLSLKIGAQANRVFSRVGRGLDSTDSFVEAVQDLAEAARILNDPTEDVTAALSKLPTTLGKTEIAALKEIGRVVDPSTWAHTIQQIIDTTKKDFIAKELARIKKAMKKLNLPYSEAEALRDAESAFAKTFSAKNLSPIFAEEFRKGLINSHRVFRDSNILDDSLIVKALDAWSKGNIVDGVAKSWRDGGKTADLVKWVSKTNDTIMGMWYNAVLSLRPAWVIRNYQDNVSRFVVAGGKWEGNLRNIINDLGGADSATMQSLARTSYSDVNNPVRHFSEGGEAPKFFMSFYWDNMKRLYKELKFGIDPSLGKGANLSKNIRSLWDAATNPIRALSRGTGDWNQWVEFSFRIRLYHQKYTANMEVLRPLLQPDLLNKLPDDLKQAGEMLLNGSNWDPVKLQQLVDLREHAVHSFVVPDAVMDIFADDPVSRRLFVGQIKTVLENKIKAARASGKIITKEEWTSTLSDIWKEIEAESDSVRKAFEDIKNRHMDLSAGRNVDKDAIINDVLEDAARRERFRGTQQLYNLYGDTKKTGKIDVARKAEIEEILADNRIVRRQGETYEQAIERAFKVYDKPLSPPKKVKPMGVRSKFIAGSEELAQDKGILAEAHKTLPGTAYSQEYLDNLYKQRVSRAKMGDAIDAVNKKGSDATLPIEEQRKYVQIGARANQLNQMMTEIQGRHREFTYAMFPFSDIRFDTATHRYLWKRFEAYHSAGRIAQMELADAIAKAVETGDFSKFDGEWMIDYYRKAGYDLTFNPNGKLIQIRPMLPVDGRTPIAIKEGPQLEEIRANLMGASRGASDKNRLFNLNTPTTATMERVGWTPEIPDVERLKRNPALVLTDPKIKNALEFTPTPHLDDIYTNPASFTDPQKGLAFTPQATISAEYPFGCDLGNNPANLRKIQRAYGVDFDDAGKFKDNRGVEVLKWDPDANDGKGAMVYSETLKLPDELTKETLSTAEGDELIKRLVEEYNVKKTAQLQEELEKAHNLVAGEGYHPVDGNYDKTHPVTGNPLIEKSFQIPGADERRGLELVKDYQQEAVLTQRGFVYNDGKVNRANPSGAGYLINPPDTGASINLFYSDVTLKTPAGEVKIRFQTDLDFDTESTVLKEILRDKGKPTMLTDMVKDIARQYVDESGRTLLKSTNGNVLKNLIIKYVEAKNPGFKFSPAAKKNMDSMIRALLDAKHNNVYIMATPDKFLETVTGAFNRYLDTHYQTNIVEQAKMLKGALLKGLKDNAHYTDYDMEMTSQLMDIMANEWAKRTGRIPEEYWLRRISGLSFTDQSLTPRMLYLEGKPPIWFSPLQNIIETQMKNEKYPDGIAVLKRLQAIPGVKKSELEVTGIDEVLMNITKEDLVNGIPSRIWIPTETRMVEAEEINRLLHEKWGNEFDFSDPDFRMKVDRRKGVIGEYKDGNGTLVFPSDDIEKYRQEELFEWFVAAYEEGGQYRIEFPGRFGTELIHELTTENILKLVKEHEFNFQEIWRYGDEVQYGIGGDTKDYSLPTTLPDTSFEFFATAPDFPAYPQGHYARASEYIFAHARGSKVEVPVRVTPIPIRWNPNSKLGGIPMQNLEYKDYYWKEALLTPKEFLKLVPKMADKQSSSYLLNAVKNGEELAPPCLFVDWNPGTGVSGGFWEITGHEGRHRAITAYAVNGNTEKIPVAVVFNKEVRGSRLTPAQQNTFIDTDLRSVFANFAQQDGAITLGELENELNKITPLNSQPNPTATLLDELQSDLHESARDVVKRARWDLYQKYKDKAIADFEEAYNQASKAFEDEWMNSHPNEMEIIRGDSNNPEFNPAWGRYNNDRVAWEDAYSQSHPLDTPDISENYGVPILVDKVDKRGNVILGPDGNPLKETKMVNKFQTWLESQVSEYELALLKSGGYMDNMDPAFNKITNEYINGKWKERTANINWDEMFSNPIELGNFRAAIDTSNNLTANQRYAKLTQAKRDIKAWIDIAPAGDPKKEEMVRAYVGIGILMDKMDDMGTALRAQSLLPKYPYSKDYNELILKRLIRKAVDDGDDYFLWTTGQQQVSRYRDVTIQWEKLGDDSFEVKIGITAPDDGTFRNYDRPYIVRTFDDVRQKLPGEAGSSWAESLWKKMKNESGDIPITEDEKLARITSKFEAEPFGVHGDRNIINRETGEVVGRFNISDERFNGTGDEVLVQVLSENNLIPSELLKPRSGGSFKPMQEGMENYYDKVIPEIFQTWAKKYGFDIEITDIEYAISGKDFQILWDSNRKKWYIASNDGLPVITGADGGPVRARYFDDEDLAEAWMDKYVAPTSRQKVHGFKITDSLRKWAAEPKPLFLQDGEGLKHGAIAIDREGRGQIQLFLNSIKKSYEETGKANPLTFLHELTHPAIADLPSEDWTVLSKWLGELPDDKKVAITGDEFFDFHRQWVEGTISDADFARYSKAQENINNGIMRTIVDENLMVAPEVKGIFHKIAKWLTDWYKKFIKNAGLEVEVPPDVRKVFTKMFGAVHEPAEEVVKMSDEVDAFWKTLKMNYKDSAYGFTDLELSNPNEFIKAAKEKATSWGLSGDTGQRDRLNQMADEVEAWCKKIQEDADTRVGNPPRTRTVPPVPKEKLNLDFQEWLSFNNESADSMNRARRAILAWQDYLSDMADKAASGDPSAVLFSNLPNDKWNELQKWSKDAAKSIDDAMDIARDGGEFRGSTFKGALNETNDAMIDYTDYKNWEQLFRTVYPFWQFPSRSTVFWSKTLLEHPQIAAWYQKYVMMSERQQYRQGLVDSNGNPLPSFRGYIRIPGLNVWVNPLAPWSARYVMNPLMGITTGNTGNITDEAGEESPFVSFIRSFYKVGADFGFSLHPALMATPAVRNVLGESDAPSQTIIPMLDLIPLNIRRFVLAKTGQMSHPVVKGLVTGEPEWQNYLIENAALKDVYQQVLANEGNPEKQYELIRDLNNAFVFTEDGTWDGVPDRDNPKNTLWLKYRRQVENTELWQKYLSYFTGVYAKPWTDADVDMYQLRHDNNLLRSMINNNIGAEMFKLSNDPVTRYNEYTDKRYQSPEGLLYSLRQAVSWVSDDEGTPIEEPMERLEVLNERLHIETVTKAYYDAMNEAREEYLFKLSKVPVGAPYEITEPIWKEYSDTVREINSDPLYVDREKAGDYSYINKPEDVLLDHYRFEWFQTLRGTLAPYDESVETYAEYSQRKLEWEKNMSKKAVDLAKTFLPQIEKDSANLFPIATWGTKGEDGKELAKRIVDQLMKETTEQGMADYYKKNDTIHDALIAAWQDLYYRHYLEDVAPKKGDEYQVALNLFNTKYPSSYLTPGMMANWILSDPIYGTKGWTRGQIIAAYTEAGVLEVEERQEMGRTEGEELVNKVFNLLSWANPGDQYYELQDAYKDAGGNPDDLTLLYNGGSEILAQPKNQERVQGMINALSKAIAQLGISEPTGADLILRVEARAQNDLWKSYVTKYIGDEVYAAMDWYYNTATDAEKRAFRKTAGYSQIEKYYQLQDSFGAIYPVWKQFYDPAKPTDSKYKTTFSAELVYQSWLDMVASAGLSAQDAMKPIEFVGLPNWDPKMAQTLGSVFMIQFMEALRTKQKLSEATLRYLDAMAQWHPEWAENIAEVIKMTGGR